jgi:hypothetical protein
MRTDYERNAAGNVTATYRCSSAHFASRAACTNVAEGNFLQQQWPNEPLKFQRFERTAYEPLDRFVLFGAVPYRSIVATQLHGQRSGAVSNERGIPHAEAVHRHRRRGSIESGSVGVYFDRLGREVLSISRVYQQSNTTLRWSATRTRYDLLGRGKEQSVPYFATNPESGTPGTPASGSSIVWNEIGFDAIGRTTSSNVQDEAGANLATVKFNRLDTTSKNARLYESTAKAKANETGDRSAEPIQLGI